MSGRGATPPAELRPGHPAQRRASARDRSDSTAKAPSRGDSTRSRRSGAGDDAPELVVGRNPVVEALRARVPAAALHVALGVDADPRLAEAVALAGKAGVPVQEVAKADLDRRANRDAGGAAHQGLALTVAAYSYRHPDDLLARAAAEPGPPLLVALDGVTDPRNLGAVIRSAAAFGASGVLVPERRAAGVTAAAWRTSAGAAARVPVARATNLVRTLVNWQAAGLFVAGLDGSGEVDLDDLEVAVAPLVLVVGSEGAGLSRLVAETCDLRVRIPMAGEVESLNAGVAAGVALAEVARRRRHADTP